MAGTKRKKPSDLKTCKGEFVVQLPADVGYKSTSEETGIKNVDIAASWRSIFAFSVKRHLSILTPAIFSVLIAGAIKPTISIFLGHSFDDLAAFGSDTLTEDALLKDISIWTIALTALGLTAWLINGAFFALWLLFGELQAQSVRAKLFVALLEKDMEWYDMRSDGIKSLLVRIQSQIRELQIATSQPFGFFFEASVASVAGLGIAFYYSWKLTLVILASVPISAGILYLIARRLGPAVEAQKRQLAKASKYAITSITAIDTVKAFNGQQHEVKQYSSSIKAAAVSYLTQAQVNALQMAYLRFASIAVFVAGFWYGTVLLNEGISPGHIFTAFYSCLLATDSAQAILRQWMVLVKGMSAGATLNQIMMQIEHGRKVSKMSGAVKPQAFNGDVEVSKVTFAYPSNPKQPALINASFFFPAGETTFVIGKSGSGKSTLSNLLLKYYEPSSGEILFDGLAIQTLDLTWLRNNVSLVQQQSTLFNETLFMNISFGRQEHELVTFGDVEQAAQMALLQDTIENLPDGLNTFLESENSMSGGQKQRVAIARARLRDAPILILDEATSALDHISRGLVMNAIRKWRQGKTTIIITHDITQILGNDYVYVLEHGRVVEDGYRNRLIQNHQGLFASFLATAEELTPDTTSRNLIPAKMMRKSDDSQSTIAEPTSTESLEDGEQPQSKNNLCHISKLFGVGEKDISMVKQPVTRRGSLSASAMYAGALRDENISEATEVAIVKGARRTKIERPKVLHRISSFLGIGDDAMQIENLGRNDTVWERTNIVLPNIVKEPILLESSSLSKPFRSLPVNEGALTFSRRQSSLQINAQGLELLELMSDKTYNNQSDTCNSKSKISSNDMVLPPHRIKPSKPSSLRFIFSTVWPILNSKDRFVLVTGIIAAFINSGSTPAFSYGLARLLNTLYVPAGREEAAKKWAIILLGIAVIDASSCYYFNYALEHCGQVWADGLRTQALGRILAQPKSWFDKKKHSPARLTEILDREAEEMRNLVGRFAGYVFVAASMMVIAVIWAFVVCWKVTLVGLASAPALYIFTRAFKTVSSKWERRTNVAADVAASIFTETFSNIRVVRALTLENYFKQKHQKAIDTAYKVGLRRAAYSGIFFGLSDSAHHFVTALILYYGAVVVSSGQWTVESVLSVVTLLLFSSGNANSMLTFIPQINSSRAAATHILHLANLPKAASHESRGTKRLPSPFPIRLQSLSFTYSSRPSVEVLHNVSLRFDAGSCTAIVGSSGSGKSTIASLLLGLYPPNEPLYQAVPSISFAGISIFDCDLNTLRSSIGFVPQTPVLFPTSIATNIAYGLDPDSELGSQSNIETAAQEAGIHEYILSLSQGYQTLIGEGGQGLSGGQQQRISIARALIRRPKILILDEATSALDVDSAKAIKDTVARLTSREMNTKGRDNHPRQRNMAVIIITHSLEMMRVAEKIIVMDHGMVVEEGKFSDLSRRGGPFATLIARGE